MARLTSEKRNQLILVVLGTVVLLGVVYLTLVCRLEDMAQTAKETCQSLQTKLASTQKGIATSLQNQEDREVTRRRLEGLEQLMPRDDHYLWMKSELAPLRRAYLGDALELLPTEKAVVDIPPKLPRYEARLFRLVAEANYANAGAFVAELENQFPFARLTRLVLDSSATGLPSADGGDRAVRLQLDFVSLVNTNAPSF